MNIHPVSSVSEKPNKLVGKRLVIWLFIILGCSYATEVKLQPGYLPIRHFTEEAGLVTNGINEKQSILQDNHGFIWLGTETGLLRYDGYQFKRYLHDHKDTTSVRSNFVTDLHLDHAGHLWVGTDRGIDRYDAATDMFEHIRLQVNGKQLQGSFIVDMVSDSAGDLWVLTKKDIVLLTEGDDGVLVSVHTGRIKSKLLGDGYEFLAMSQYSTAGHFMIATRKSGMVTYQPENGSTELFVDFLFNAANGSNEITSLYKDREHQVWVGTSVGLMLYNPTAKSFRTIAQMQGLAINDIVRGQDGLIYVASSGGLLFYNPVTNAITAYRHELTEPYTSVRDEIQTVFIDDHDNLWIGTRGHGIDKLSKKTKQFNNYLAHEMPNQLALPEILSIERFNANRFLLGTKKGLFVFDQDEGDYQFFDTDLEIINEGYITSVLRDGQGQYWISVLQEGIVVMNENGGVIRKIKYVSTPGLENCLLETWVLTLDKEGNIWAGTQEGILVFDPGSGRVMHAFREGAGPGNLRGRGIRALLGDAAGRMWIGSSAGLSMWNSATESFKHIEFPKDTSTQWAERRNEIGAICESQRNSLWISTLNGIFEFYPEEQAFELLTFPEQIQSSMVISMITDRSGNLWLSAMNGVWQYQPLEKKFTHYSTSDGLATTSFSPSNLLDTDGSILFGSESGILKFHPDDIRVNTYTPPIKITELKIFHTPVDIRDENSPIDTPIYLAEEIQLQYWQNVVGFRFSALNYTSTEKNTYAYKLEGFDEDWHFVGTRNEAVYTNLDPGSYVFRVKGSNNDGIWNEEGAELKIEILPPWWKTGLAYSLYVVLVLAIITAGHFFQKRRLELKHKLEIEKQEARRLKELDDSKSRLYANITHEFRTPLTLISGMASEIKTDPGAWSEKGTAIIQRHSTQLLNLVNQMLELSKLESGALHPDMTYGDIVKYTKYIIQSFQSFAQTKRIRMHFLSDIEIYRMDYDPDMYLQILSNLVSNALKFTPEKGNIYVSIAELEMKGKRYLGLKVRDTGIGIGPEVHQIFERYFQGTYAKEKGIQGTGIGLALTKDLVHFLGGEIHVKSAPGKGAEFHVVLPVTEEAMPETENVAEEVIQSRIAPYEGILHSDTDFLEPEDPDSDLPELLVVEDNPDVAQYIHSCLKGKYRVKIETDGDSGVNNALAMVPDLMIVDLMVPVKSGFEVAREVKMDERTSHIPIIILTALGDRETKLEALRIGVDDFLTKPFDKEELLLRLNNALAIRNNMHGRYTSDREPEAKTDNPSVQKEDNFITRIRSIMHEHIDDDSFGIPHLCRELNMSRTQLHNKIKALTGRSTSRFLRLIRLQEAKLMLSDPELNVSQVAYDVGFKDPNYFSRVFAEEFGFPPSHLSK